MKKLLWLPLLMLAGSLGYLAFQSAPSPIELPVNPLLGDISFVQKFGRLPDANTDEDLRIRTHFEYVEAYLRSVDVSALTPAQRARRAEVIDHLHDYAVAGIFPRNYDHPGERRPCFIDRDGRICAVGYLVEQTAGREAAENINQSHQYDRLLAMNDARIDDWIASSGLTKTECALIQPTYGWQDPSRSNHDYVTRASAIATAGFVGLNLGMSSLNGLQMLRKSGSKAVPVLSIVSGAGQIALGVATMPRSVYTDNWGYIHNDRQQNHSMLNIGMGSASLVFGIANLAMNRKPNPKAVSWNLYGYPAGQKQMGVGFSLTKMM